MKLRIIILAIVASAGLAVWWFVLRSDQSPTPSSTDKQSAIDQVNKAVDPIDELGNISWIVNKNRPLPDDYVPADLTVPNIAIAANSFESSQVREVIAKDLEAMYRAAVQAGQRIVLLSAYRSYDTQEDLYSNYVQAYGEDEANRFSAKPGTSEHQTGLVVDIGREDGECKLETCFGELKEGQWLASNAHLYGFIVRYLDGKEAITGYMYEPWHFRYVGKELAKSLYDSGKTMEEYFGLN
jgi:LAS superfamily LD-carboxypeptidase LdcB